MPAIDPFSAKNRELSEDEIDERLAHYDIPTDLPTVVQVSRFDPWKDPQGVIAGSGRRARRSRRRRPSSTSPPTTPRASRNEH